mgnify:FL=1
MTSTSKRTQRDYSLAFKIAVVEQVEKGEMTYIQAQQRYGIQGRSTVLTWLRKHGTLNWSNTSSPFVQRIHIMTDTKQPLTPEQRIKELERELKETKIKAAFFEEVVTVLQRDYGMTVPKKLQIKSSKLKR